MVNSSHSVRSIYIIYQDTNENKQDDMVKYRRTKCRTRPTVVVQITVVVFSECYFYSQILGVYMYLVVYCMTNSAEAYIFV